jgi:hypothetical protein
VKYSGVEPSNEIGDARWTHKLVKWVPIIDVKDVDDAMDVHMMLVWCQ